MACLGTCVLCPHTYGYTRGESSNTRTVCTPFFFFSFARLRIYSIVPRCSPESYRYGRAIRTAQLMDGERVNFRHVVAKCAHPSVRLTLSSYFGCWGGITLLAHQPIRQRYSRQYQPIAATKMADRASQASQRYRNRVIPEPKGTLHFVQDSKGRNGASEGSRHPSRTDKSPKVTAGMTRMGDAFNARTVTLFWTHRDRL
ncbi:uncharacterized protein LY79DRAFT_369130 [Colletotrichum navitas]|uniref:Uncharacterized protein n=1 Tax=Colletotrichum navitas TaxID=681940 RepID=A0AAD8PQ23_9PEZI|nr:uncharacterized protein LY79DRAFT_369130 [Colletotrichum navitas]KAK1574300.1 hypothetical protein LY79DRAFT_369130 [Colletotrichum navitas]